MGHVYISKAAQHRPDHTQWDQMNAERGLQHGIRHHLIVGADVLPVDGPIAKSVQLYIPLINVVLLEYPRRGL